MSYGPFHRLRSPTQTDEDADLQAATSELWGRPRQFSDIPQVQAWVGPLPEGESGVEFTTAVPPDPFLPPGHARWTGPRDGVRVEGEFAKISVRLTRQEPTT